MPSALSLAANTRPHCEPRQPQSLTIRQNLQTTNFHQPRVGKKSGDGLSVVPAG